MAKVKYIPVLETLQNLINAEYGHTEVSKDLAEYGIIVTANALTNRASNDGYLKAEELEALEKKYKISLTQANTNDTITVDFYPDVFGSCGGGAFALSEHKEQIQVPRKLFNEFSKVKTYSVINAYGDSMQPEIKNGDRLIVEHWEGEQIRDNQVYVFCYKDEIFVKRLIKNIDQVVIKSDNEIYPMRFIEKEDLKSLLVVGRIVGLMRNMGL